MQVSNRSLSRYLFFVELSYAFDVLRPIELAIKKRGGEVCWFSPKGSEAEKYLLPSDKRLTDIAQVKEYNPEAILAPGNYIPDFFPGIKVQVFHGLDSGKKNRIVNRGLFDIYCTLGPQATAGFKLISDESCEIIETGWSKLDRLFTEQPKTKEFQHDKPVVFYAPTFSPSLTSTKDLFPYIEKLTKTRDWQWLIKLHPKATQEDVEMYRNLASDKLVFIETNDMIPLLQAADIIVSDTSSVITEFALLEKPVVTFNNRTPKDWMINFKQAHMLEDKIEQALQKDVTLKEKMKAYGDMIHPAKDSCSSERVLNAIEDLNHRGLAQLKPRPFNLIRRLKARKKLGYYRWT